MTSRERLGQMRMTDACAVRHAAESALQILRAMRGQSLRAGNNPRMAHSLIQKGFKSLQDLAFGIDVPGNGRPTSLLEVIFGSEKQFSRLMTTQKTNPRWMSQVLHLIRLGTVNLEQFQETLEASIADIEKKNASQRSVVLEDIETKTARGAWSTDRLGLAARTISHHKTFE